MKVSVLGAGSWGTSLSILLSKNNLATVLWSRTSRFATTLQDDKENKVYLEGHLFPESLRIVHSLAEAVAWGKLLVIAIPTQAVRSVLSCVSPEQIEGKIIVIVCKGVEVSSGMRVTDIVRELFPTVKKESIAILNGPSHAKEVVLGYPTSVVCACKSKKIGETIQSLFQSDMFRVYLSQDVIGVEISGAIKNIVAIAAGIAEGLGYGDNTRASIITRGVLEISRFGLSIGAKAETFLGLAGLGDIAVTCQSQHSRNRQVGFLVGRGEKVENIAKSMKMIAEGVATTRIIAKHALEIGIAMPIVEAVNQILFHEAEPRATIIKMMKMDF